MIGNSSLALRNSDSGSIECGQLITAIDNSVTSLRVRIVNGLDENVRISVII
jgi:hypothetical protein